MKYLFVSDIHSNIKSLNQLVNHYKNKDIMFVFMGDYIDGFNQDSMAGLKVIDKVMELVNSKKAIALLGNHDEWMATITNPEYSNATKFIVYNTWLHNGGLETWDKWGINKFMYDNGLMDFHHLSARNTPNHPSLMDVIKFLDQPLIRKYGEFLHGLPIYCELGNVIAVHGHFDFPMPLQLQTADSMLWSRNYEIPDDVIIHPDFKGKTIISGHTPVQSLSKKRDNKPITFDSRGVKRHIIDGGSSSGLGNGVINAVILDNNGNIIELSQW